MARAIPNKSGQRGNPLPTSAPHFTGDKERYVRDMFAAIAPQYDLLNAILSFNQHKAWRRLAVKISGARPGDRCLDVCTGTGDLALDLAGAVSPGGSVVGADFCEPMIRSGLTKTLKARDIQMMVANAEALPYPTNSFAVVTVGFGVRNVAHVEQAVREMARVVKPGGKVVVLEFSRPPRSWYRPFIDFYLFRVLPFIGGMLSRREAYSYLPESMKHFVSREELASVMEQSGLASVVVRSLNFGTVCIHSGTKTGAQPGSIPV